MRLTQAFAVALLAGCSPSAAPATTPPPTAPAASAGSAPRVEPEEAEGEPVGTEGDDEPEVQAPRRRPSTPAVPSVRRLDRTPLVGTAPTIEIRRPRHEQLFRGEVMVQLDVVGWELAAPPGNHVHVKVDDREELAVHDASRPFSLDDLYRERFGEDLPDGSHLLRVFLSRGNHESVKLPTAFAMIVFHKSERTSGFEVDLAAPILTYSRPQGCAADSSRLLDFFLWNLNDLSPTGYRVAYEIDGSHRGVLTDWAPHRIDDLRRGEHTIRLSLLSPAGDAVPGPFNDTTRTLSVGAGCPHLGLIPEDAYGEDEEALE